MTPGVTFPGFTPFNLTNISGIPAPVTDMNPSVTVGAYTFAIQGVVGGFGLAATPANNLIRDFMFLGAGLGYDESVGYTISGLQPNTPYRLTWIAATEGGADRSSLITTECDSGNLVNDGPDLALFAVSDCNGVISGTMTRNGANTTEANISGLVVEEGDPVLTPKGTYGTQLSAACIGTDFVSWDSLLITQTLPPGGDVVVAVSNSTDTVGYGLYTNQSVISLTGVTDTNLNVYITLCSTQTDPCLSPIVEQISGIFECEAEHPTNLVQITDAVLTNAQSCEVTIERTYRYETCCGLADEETVVFTYTREPDLTSGPLMPLQLGCIASTNQIPPMDLTMVTATSDCAIVRIWKHAVGPTGLVDACTYTNQRIFVVETLCGVSNFVTQAVSWVLNNTRPEITGTETGQYWGCQSANFLPASFVAHTNATNAAGTAGMTHIRATNGCEVTLTRIYRVSDCCGNFDRREVVHTFTLQPGPLTVEALGPLDLGIVSIIQTRFPLPAPPWSMPLPPARWRPFAGWVTRRLYSTRSMSSQRTSPMTHPPVAGWRTMIRMQHLRITNLPAGICPTRFPAVLVHWK